MAGAKWTYVKTHKQPDSLYSKEKVKQAHSGSNAKIRILEKKKISLLPDLLVF